MCYELVCGLRCVRSMMPSLGANNPSAIPSSDMSHQILYVPAMGSMLDEGTEPKWRYFHDARMWDHSMSMYLAPWEYNPPVY